MTGARPGDGTDQPADDDLLARNDQLWRERLDEFAAYIRQVSDLANTPALPVLRRVYCGECPDGAKALGEVLVTDLGPLLSAVQPHDEHRRGFVAEAKAHGLSVGRPLRVGFVLGGDNRIAVRFPWRPPDTDEWPPRVWCPVHGARTADRLLDGGRSRRIEV